MKRTRFFLWRASLVRAWLEAWLLGGALFFAVLWQVERVVAGTLLQAMLLMVTLAAAWYGFRLQIPEGGRTRRVFHELVAALSYWIATASWLLGAYLFGWWYLFQDALGGSLGISLIVLGSVLEFVTLRFGIWLWLLWQRLRRRRLLWELTHMQVQLVLLLALVPAAGFSLAVLLSPQRMFGLDLIVRTLFPVLGVLGMMFVFLLVGVLPPAAVLAFLAARRTTGRLDSLAQTATALRQGDYTARIEVRGEDEVAQLQADFNAMAADLQATLQALAAERDKVAALLQAQRELTAAVSHELRTPIATVQGYLEQSQAQWDEAPAGLQGDLAIVEGEIIRLQRLIDDLFALSRAEVGELALELKPTDVNQVIRRVVETWAPLAWQRSRVELTAEYSPDLPLALADQDRLVQILTNLLRNGVRHTPPGGIVAVMAAAEDTMIRIEVRDTGQGIPPEELPLIWQRFYRGRDAQDAGEGGAGLGLALVKELTEAMEGSVGVGSVAGQGTCFAISLPIA